jgi:formyl-CoA transferase
MWIRFCEALEAPQFLKNPAYATSDSRSKNRDDLNREISEITRTRSSADWVARFNKTGVPSGPIYAMDEVFDDPQVKHLQMVERLETHLRGPIHLTGQPVKLSRTPSHLVVARRGLSPHARIKDGVFNAYRQDADDQGRPHRANGVQQSRAP